MTSEVDRLNASTICGRLKNRGTPLTDSGERVDTSIRNREALLSQSVRCTKIQLMPSVTTYFERAFYTCASLTSRDCFSGNRLRSSSPRMPGKRVRSLWDDSTSTVFV